MSKRGLVNNRNWTDAELAVLKRAYDGAVYRGDVCLAALSAQLGRSKSAISRKAAQCGLANGRRPVRITSRSTRRKFESDADRSAAASERMKQLHSTRPHPMLGKQHTESARAKISQRSKKSWENSGDARRDMQSNMLRAVRIAAPEHPRGSWKAGWREIGGHRKYYRSRWEANYARYLQWLVNRGDILDWKHEPETFWFESIKRGVRSYLPDFRVWEIDGSSKLHEVKGWMDARSRTTLKRMAKYHPGETIVLIKEKDYRAIANTVGRMIEGWE